MKNDNKANDIIIDSVKVPDSYKPPKNPIVFCHGLSGFDKLILIPSVFHLTNLISNSIVHNMAENFMQDDEDKSDNKYTNCWRLNIGLALKNFFNLRDVLLSPLRYQVLVASRKEQWLWMLSYRKK